MTILFVDDLPDIKVRPAIDYLNAQNIKFDYVICKSIYSAIRYIKEHTSDIDLAVIDFGLPVDDNSFRFRQYGGLDIIDYILDTLELDIPIIINSTSHIKMLNNGDEEDYFSDYENSLIEHVDNLTGQWLYEFLKEHLKEKLELL